jgi:transcriptional regulator of nitric oxide reductase
MAEADLDTLIRSIAKKQIKALTSAAKARHGRLIGMAAKAKDRDARARYRHLAKSTLEHASAAARRLQITAENTADAYKRAMAKAAEEAQALKPAKKAAVKKTTKK